MIKQRLCLIAYLPLLTPSLERGSYDVVLGDALVGDDRGWMDVSVLEVPSFQLLSIAAKFVIIHSLPITNYT